MYVHGGDPRLDLNTTTILPSTFVYIAFGPLHRQGYSDPRIPSFSSFSFSFFLSFLISTLVKDFFFFSLGRQPWFLRNLCAGSQAAFRPVLDGELLPLPESPLIPYTLTLSCRPSSPRKAKSFNRRPTPGLNRSFTCTAPLASGLAIRRSPPRSPRTTFGNQVAGPHCTVEIPSRGWREYTQDDAMLISFPFSSLYMLSPSGQSPHN